MHPVFPGAPPDATIAPVTHPPQRPAVLSALSRMGALQTWRALLTDQLSPWQQGLSVCIPGIPSTTMGQGVWLYPSLLPGLSRLAPYSHSRGRH